MKDQAVVLSFEPGFFGVNNEHGPDRGGWGHVEACPERDTTEIVLGVPPGMLRALQRTTGSNREPTMYEAWT